jgi:hypothetical protein
MVFMAILGIIDILAALTIRFPEALAILSTALGIILLIKSISSFIGSFATGFFFEILGIIDLIAALSLLFGWSIPVFWVIVLIKGLISFLSGLGGG